MGDLNKILEDVGAEIGGEGSLPIDWISSGNYCLNKLMSGTLDKAIPVGRIVALAGESGVGKSLLTACFLREAQKKGYFGVIFDSESAMDSTFLGNLGVDTKRIAYIQVDTVEQFRNKIVKILENADPEQKMFFVLDSMGNLSTEKELNDALEGKIASDMGLKSKTIRATFRVIANMINKTNSTLVVTNHTYTNASGYVPQQVMSAGAGLYYNASIVVMLKKKKLRDGQENVGITITATTDKNRFTPPFKSIVLDLDFAKGLQPTTGLLDVLIEQGVIEQRGGWLAFKDEKFRRKEFDEWAKTHLEELLEFDVPTKFAEFKSVEEEE